MTREKLINAGEFERLLGQSRFDAVVAVSQPSVFYTSGARITTQIEIRDRLALTVLPKAGNDVLVVCSVEESLAKDDSWIDDVRCYVEFAQSPVSVLADVLDEKGLAQGRIGIEKKYLTAAYYEELIEALPLARFEGCDWLFDSVRSIKTEGEIERFRLAALATERGIVEAFREVEIGQTEMVLLQSALGKVAELGASDIRFGVVAAGDQISNAHARARERDLQRGDLVRVDIKAVFDGYVSDVARTAVVGTPSELQKETYRKHRQVQRAVIDHMRPGVRARDAYEFCKQAYADLGFKHVFPHVGHGLGLGGPEAPMLEPHNSQELRPNMLMCVEPACLDKIGGGYQLEDLVLIKEGGCEILTTYAPTEELFVIR